MVEIGGKPILSHIMGIYRKYGHNDFVIACGYKGDTIRDYYKHDLNVTCLDTGLDTGTGERVRMCAEAINEPFMMTYGDGVADINIQMLIGVHNIWKRPVTVTAVHPQARFGQLKIQLHNDKVMEFNEKATGQEEWINGGFFVVEAYPNGMPSFEFDFLPRLVQRNELTAYRHTGFWQCMDTQRDVDYLNQLVQEGRAPWL